LAFIAAMLAAIAIVAVVSLTSREPYIGLHPSGGFTANGEFPSTNIESISGARYGSWSGSDGNIGTLESGEFRVGPEFELSLAGYPSHAGVSVYLEKRDGRERFSLAHIPNPGERWTRVIYRLPRSWIGAPVRLRAIDESRTFQGWVGVADGRNISIVNALLPTIPWRVLAWASLSLTLVLALLPTFFPVK
jgi:hypothetical protein